MVGIGIGWWEGPVSVDGQIEPLRSLKITEMAAKAQTTRATTWDGVPSHSNRENSVIPSK